MFSNFLETWIGMTVLAFVVIFVMFSLLFFLSWDEADRKEGFQVAFFIALFFCACFFERAVKTVVGDLGWIYSRFNNYRYILIIWSMGLSALYDRHLFMFANLCSTGL